MGSKSKCPCAGSVVHLCSSNKSHHQEATGGIQRQHIVHLLLCSYLLILMFHHCYCVCIRLHHVLKQLGTFNAGRAVAAVVNLNTHSGLFSCLTASDCMEWSCLLACFVFEHVLLCHCPVFSLSTIKVYSRMPAAHNTQQPKNAIKHVFLWQRPCVIVAGNLTHQKMLTLAAAHEHPETCAVSVPHVEPRL